jgi:small conductance mechanosensitive channel
LLEKKEISPTLIPFIRGIVSVLLKILLIVSVMAMMGIEMLSFSALIGAVGLAIGMALSGTLQNFAGGVLILILKPYKPGDYIEAQGYAGTVSQIQIFNTILKTPDNKVIIIPNGGLSTGSMINYSEQTERRVDWTFGIAYGDSADKAKEVLQRLCDEDERILKDPPVFIGLSKLDNSSVNFVVRAWVKTPDYWGVFFDMNEKVYHTFEKEGLSIPFPQMDVHLHNK